MGPRTDHVRSTVMEVPPVMSLTYFVQQCPTCGRSLQIRVEYLGKRVVCQHCRGRFEAVDPSSQPADLSSSGMDLLRRADELLDSVTLHRSRAG